MIDLHIKTMGQGDDLVLLHGWAMHGGIWPDVLLEKLAQTYRLHIVDLPGHGESRSFALDFSIDNIRTVLEQALLPQLSDKTVIIGWSLGGLVAASLVLEHPSKFKKLILIATSLRFTKNHDWPEAVDAKVLELFANNLVEDYKTTLSRFLALQFSGDEHARQGLKVLKQKIFSQPTPAVTILKQGLDILLTADLRQQGAGIACPVLFVGGEHDTLAPALALSQISETIPYAEVAIIKGASHAPFISHQHEFQEVVTGFLNG